MGAKRLASGTSRNSAISGHSGPKPAGALPYAGRNSQASADIQGNLFVGTDRTSFTSSEGTTRLDAAAEAREPAAVRTRDKGLTHQAASGSTQLSNSIVVADAKRPRGTGATSGSTQLSSSIL